MKGVIIKSVISYLVIGYCYGELFEGPRKFEDISVDKADAYLKWNLKNRNGRVDSSSTTVNDLSRDSLEQLGPRPIPTHTSLSTANYVDGLTDQSEKNLKSPTTTEQNSDEEFNLMGPSSTDHPYSSEEPMKTTSKSLISESALSKSLLPQKPSFAGQMSSGQLGQLVPPGKPWPAGIQAVSPILEDRFKETTALPPSSVSTSSKSPLEYNPQRPSFSSQLSSGQLGQLIPPGKPWPAEAPAVSIVLEDRFKETTVSPTISVSTSSKSPLEYNPQRPSFAGQLSGGQLGQLISPGKPWPAEAPAVSPVFEDRFKETTAVPPLSVSTPSKSPLESSPQEPSFAGQLSSGQLGQLVAPGKPLAANCSSANPIVEDHFKETTSLPPISVSTSDESPLEYKPQKPSFSGQLSSGQLGQLVPPGKPWPADAQVVNQVLEDRFKETTALPPSPLSTSTKSPLEYKPQRPSYFSQLSSGQLGQLVPPGKPWPADPPAISPILEDRFKETTMSPSISLSTSSKSPLEYNPQRPSFAGQLSGGQLGQLIPPGKPWPANPQAVSPVFEDRFKETTVVPPISMITLSNSPLEYNPQKPSFAGQLSSGQLGQLIPPGKPWPADPPAVSPALEDRFKETTMSPSISLSTSSKSPLEYNPQRPSFAGQLSGGQLGQLIPPGKPWIADPPAISPALEDRFKETTLSPPILLSTSSKSPLEYNPQRPSFAGQLSGGQLGQLIPPGKSWPADAPAVSSVIEDRFKETTSVLPL